MRLSPARDLHQNSGPSGAESPLRGRPLLLNSATEGGPGRPRMRRPPHSGSSRPDAVYVLLCCSSRLPREDHAAEGALHHSGGVLEYATPGGTS
ncbi:hypothetical protein NDU88_005605 [Pleurodeles waltl]|uniref:Uncharacterized protein n=1 Tax=Pleurodeles waltl TaxID=8319 RepID=A0AAV7NMV3_PLEWA|nr:hypothetical protein NDU88_005605 [Pleurodeles waltl]